MGAKEEGEERLKMLQPLARTLTHMVVGRSIIVEINAFVKMHGTYVEICGKAAHVNEVPMYFVKFCYVLCEGDHYRFLFI